MTTKNADIGLVGLAVMGQNLALNIADHGYTIAVYNRDPKKMVNFIEECKKNEPSHENVIGHVLSVDQPESPLLFSKVADGFESNATYAMSSDILNGKIYVEIPTIITSKS